MKEKLSENIGKYIQKKVTINYKINPAILGGFITEIESMLIDASLKTRLHKMKHFLLQERGH